MVSTEIPVVTALAIWPSELSVMKVNRLFAKYVINGLQRTSSQTRALVQLSPCHFGGGSFFLCLVVWLAQVEGKGDAR